MDYVNTRLGYRQRPSDAKQPNYYDEDAMDPAALDPALLDTDIQVPGQSQYRKDSFANSTGVLSPAESHGWDHHQFNGIPVNPTSIRFSEDPKALGQHPAHYPSSAYVHQHQPHPPQWKFEQGSGNCTPTTGADLMPPPPFDNSHAHFQSPTFPFFNHLAHPPRLPPQQYSDASQSTYAGPSQLQTPLSPHSHQDWKGMPHQESESQSTRKQIRPNSVDLARRDGIRKKNSRIDIPSERNIHTIDEMIDKTTDEDMLKELKQQKRLLRNREAALASRQRKKKHTEDLEIKEKGFAHTIASLSDSLTELHSQRQGWEDERQAMLQTMQEQQRDLDTLQARMREMSIQHCDETSNLRREINMLTDQLEAGPAPAMSVAPSSTGFTDFNAEMGALDVGADEWDNLLFVNGLHADPDEIAFDPRSEHAAQSPTLKKQSSNSTIVPFPKNTVETTPEQPVASSLLFMLLLLGAFAVSKPGTTQIRDLPNMPPDVQAAAPAVLHSLLAEAGPATLPNLRLLHEPQASNIAQVHPRNTGKLQRTQTNPLPFAPQQETAHQFQLTGVPYTPTANERPESAPRGHRRNLAEALSHIQQEHRQTSKAEVYTRSLLWDQIPPEIISQFKEMVREHDELNSARRGKQPAGNGM